MARILPARDRQGRFEPASLETAQLQVYLLCRDVHSAPQTTHAGSVLRMVQEFFEREDPHGAINLLEKVLSDIPLRARQPFDVDRERFASLRELRQITQQQLGGWLGVTPAAISHFEARGGNLRLAHLLLAAEYLDVPANQFVRARRPRLAASSDL